jgi:ubiquinone/menaquinone biosynthesis C-methylase UbiE
MGWFEEKIGSALVACACSSKPIMKERKKIVPLASGKVFELGMGAGANLGFYDRSRVESIASVEPSAAMRARAMKAAEDCGASVDLIEGVGEALPYADASFDCVVCTYTLCTVGDVAQTLKEARRVLKPGGRFLFCEHGAAPDEGPARWQRRLEPLWKPLAGGCHLTRDPLGAVRAAGFSIGEVEQHYLPNTPRPLGYITRGVGTAP